MRGLEISKKNFSIPIKQFENETKYIFTGKYHHLGETTQLIFDSDASLLMTINNEGTFRGSLEIIELNSRSRGSFSILLL